MGNSEDLEEILRLARWRMKEAENLRRQSLSLNTLAKKEAENAEKLARGMFRLAKPLFFGYVILFVLFVVQLVIWLSIF